MKSLRLAAERPAGEETTDEGNHFSCSMSSVIVDYFRTEMGDEAVGQLLAEADSPRTPEYLEDLANWISYDEAIALLRAGKVVSGDEDFPFKIGNQAAHRLAGSPVASLLRSLGSPEEVWRHFAETATKFNTVTTQEVLEAGPGYSLVKIGPKPGFPRSADHCRQTQGLLTGTPILFGLNPAQVEHLECAATGTHDACLYRVTWETGEAGDLNAGNREVEALKSQLDAMTERLQSMFATAADLIASDDLDLTLARITDRAALEVRAPRYLLAVRPAPGDDLTIHFKGCSEPHARAVAKRALSEDTGTLPESWLVARVGSARHDYGCIVAMHDPSQRFFSQERQLLEVYARYAATALDSATALREAKRRHAEANALLQLARSLALAATSTEIALRVCEAVPYVVECDRIDFLIRSTVDGELESAAGLECATATEPTPVRSEVTAYFDRCFSNSGATRFINEASDDPDDLRLLLDLQMKSAAIVPIHAHGHFLATLIVSASEKPKRLEQSDALADLLSGVAAHATSAIENGKLIDRITFQALHDDLTGLANRANFTDRLSAAAREAEAIASPFTLFYLDLDRFKSVNDDFGHDVGDDLLREVAQRLSDCVRADDTVARLGGDEFAVIVEGTDSQKVAAAVEQRIVEAFQKPFELDGNQLDVGVSIGRANWGEHAADVDGLVRHADSRMYDVKREHHAAIDGPAQTRAHG